MGLNSPFSLISIGETQGNGIAFIGPGGKSKTQRNYLLQVKANTKVWVTPQHTQNKVSGEFTVMMLAVLATLNITACYNLKGCSMQSIYMRISDNSFWLSIPYL